MFCVVGLHFTASTFLPLHSTSEPLDLSWGDSSVFVVVEMIVGKVDHVTYSLRTLVAFLFLSS